MKRPAWALLAAVLMLGSTISAFTLTNVTQWTIADGGNDHWYGLLNDRLDWDAASSMAITLGNGANSDIGYLSTITSQAENEFVFGTVLSGISDPAWPGQSQFLLGGYWNGSSWGWSTGEGYSYTHWNAGEPNSPDETVISMWGGGAYPPSSRLPGYWNDTGRDFGLWSIIEWGTNYNYVPGPAPLPDPTDYTDPIPEPSTFLILGIGLLGVIAVRKL